MLVKIAPTFRIPFADGLQIRAQLWICLLSFRPVIIGARWEKLGSFIHNRAVKAGTNAGNAIFLQNDNIWLIEAGWCFLWGVFWEEKGLSSSKKKKGNCVPTYGHHSLDEFVFGSFLLPCSKNSILWY